jgi:glycolate oxidase FAD binding subunit
MAGESEYHPRDEKEVAAIFAEVREQGGKVLPAGTGTKLAWLRPFFGSVPGGLVVVRSGLLSQITDLDPANLTVSVQAGMSLLHLQETLASHGQWLPMESPWGDGATVGGIVSAGLAGPASLGYGLPRDLVLGVRAVLPNGRAVRFGGKTVKNVAGYDVSKLFVGSFGSLGILVEITFRLRPLPPGERTVLVGGLGYSELDEAIGELLRSPQPIVALEVLNQPALRRLGWPFPSAEGGCGIAVRIDGAAPVLSAAVDKLRKVLSASVPDRALDVLDEPSSRQFWQRFRERLYGDWAEPCAVLRIRCRVRDVVEVVQRLSGAPEAAVWLGAGTGHGFLRVERGYLSRGIVEYLEGLRGSLTERETRLDLFSVPAEDFPKLMDSKCLFWQLHPKAQERAGRLKRIFDPEGLLVPFLAFGGTDGN